MRVKTEILPVEIRGQSNIVEAVLRQLTLLERPGRALLRWGILSMEGTTAIVEIATILDAFEDADAYGAETPDDVLESNYAGVHVALVIPTGVGASTGGFIGDASPVARALEAVADTIILHPNVVNAADFYGGGPRCLYVDGLTLDRFFAGQVQLGPPSLPNRARIGLILDRLDPVSEVRLLNAANGIRAVHAIEMVGYAVCTERVRAHVTRSDYGHFVGEVENPQVLFEAAEVLRSQGADALSVVTAIDGISDEDWLSHYTESGPNPIGSIEALISRAITWKTGLPCAHAPAFLEGQGIGQTSTVIDPRAAAEVASGSGLPCVLNGLAQTPKIIQRGGIGAHDLTAVIVPFDCVAGPPALPTLQLGVPLVAVRSNRCVVGVDADTASIPATVVVENYAEAVAFVACRKAGVSWDSILGPVKPLVELSLQHA